MTLEEMNFIAEIIASIAVIASLMYVGLQVRHNTRQHRAEAFGGAINELIYEIAETTADDESINNFRDGLHDFNSMTPNARGRFHSRMLSLVAGYALVLVFFDTRLLDEAKFLGL